MLIRIVWIVFVSVTVVVAQSTRNAQALTAEQSGETVNEITRLEHEMVGAKSANFRDADYLQVTGNGSVFDPAKIAATEKERQSVARRLERYDKDDIRVRAYGDTAFAMGRITARMQGGKDYQLRYINVWVKRSDGWRIVAQQYTPIQPQGARSLVQEGKKQ
jgi:hypothetical protein